MHVNVFTALFLVICLTANYIGSSNGKLEYNKSSSKSMKKTITKICDPPANTTWCLNGGTCIQEIEGTKQTIDCVCPTAWTGKRCEVPIARKNGGKIDRHRN